jgi:hypothetical protein
MDEPHFRQNTPSQLRANLSLPHSGHKLILNAVSYRFEKTPHVIFHDQIHSDLFETSIFYHRDIQNAHLPQILT